MDELVQRWTAQLLDSGSALTLLLGLVALGLISNHGTWRLLRNVVTIAHEGGHAVVALLSGRTLNGIRLHSDTSGLTLSTGRPSGPGMVFTLFAGYPAVSLLGLGGAAMVGFDLARQALWVAIGLLVIMLLAIRNAYGVLSVVLTGGALFAVSWFAAPAWQAVCCVLVSWFLLLGGLRPIAELRGKRNRGRAPSSDADQLARLTRVPAGAWLGVWFLIGIAALVIGGRWLLLIPQL
ncbi:MULTISPECIES: M50 family metallopeptidase [unclassified Saccharopolyspora]|uniref:M50 family metallopeptidase n=1 Tax=Saccharopolyspora TaxID=1835 RepID=UPI00190C9121|nr:MULTISPECIES: M50 family metallopeptidase [unclassified Saccharopolyspora]MBK0869179.1 M50 family metallopeptidase [Saccharopolyspora sp. HNM0986]